MKKLILSFVAVAVLILGISPANSFAKQRTFYVLATGGTGGTYYPLGGALAQLLSNNTDIIVTAQTGNASVANCNLISKHQVEMAFVQNNVAYWAYTGTGLFKGKKPIRNLRAIASLYPETIQIVARADSGINSIYDLKGKRVVPGNAGSGTAIDAKNILTAAGLSFKDMHIDYLGFAQAAQRLADNQIDAAFVTAGYPTSSILQLAITTPIKIIPISGKLRAKILKNYKYYAKDTVPAGTYKGINKPVPTISAIAQWVVDSKLPANKVYEMTKALWQHRDILAKVHAKGKLITLDTALDGVAIPLHPGAKRFYKEKGLIK